MPDRRRRTSRQSHLAPMSQAIQFIAEPLERRMLLSISPAGSEFQVNVFTTNAQLNVDIAADADGDFVIVWQSGGQDGATYGVFARRYNSAGVAQGSEFRVNSYTPSAQENPSIAMNAGGDFVIAWTSAFQDGDVLGVYAQRYNASGVPQGGEFRANNYTTGNQGAPSVAIDSIGDFVISWASFGQDGSNYGIYARRYSAAGVPQGGEFRVNAVTTFAQMEPSAAMDTTGDFVITWMSQAQDPDFSNGIYAQRYNAAGMPQGAEFRVNTYITNTQTNATAAMDADGDFVIAWDSLGQDGSNYGIYAQRYNAAGAPQGSEFRANTFTNNSQSVPSAAMNAGGNFVITWQSDEQDTSGLGIYGRDYNSAGVPQGSEFRANTNTPNWQARPAVARDAEGDFIVAWSSQSQDGSNYGVYAQRYEESVDLAPPVVVGVFVHDSRVLPYSAQRPSLDQIVVSFSENVTDATNPANWLLTRNGADVTASISSITYGLNVITNRYETALNLSTSYTTGNFLLMAKDNIRDLASNQLDGNLDGASGGNLLLPFSIAALAPSAEFRVNSYTTSGQARPSIAMDTSGNSVIVWESNGQDGSLSGIYAQRYDAAGNPQGSEFLVNTYTTGVQSFPATAMDTDGDFVVAWESNDGSSFGVYAQRYSAAGAAQGSEFQVNIYTTSAQASPSIAMDADGDFIVTWSSYGQDGSLFGVYARRYSADGVPQGGEFRVNTETFGEQHTSSIAMDADGDFVVGWTSFQDGSDFGTYAQRYDAAGAPQGSEFRVNSYTTGSQSIGSIAMNADGDFVVTWHSYSQDGSHYGIYARRYNAAGIEQGSEFRVNTYTTNSQSRPSLAMDAAGNFLITWQSFQQDGSSYSVHAQAFSAAGVAQGGEFQVNTYTTNSQQSPSVAMHADGHFVITWGSIGQDGDSYGVYARRYTASAPVVGTLADSPDPVSAGSTLTLDASAITDDGTVTSVSFYRETNGQPGLQVGFQGDTLVGTDTTDAGGIWSVDVSTTGLAAGSYQYWAQATDDVGLTGTPASTVNTVTPDVTPPAVNSSTLEFQTRQAISITFNEPLNPATVAASDLGALNLDNASTPAANSVILSAGNTIATWVFNIPGTFISDGDYTFTLPAGAVSDVSGNALAAQHQVTGAGIFFFAADANRDRQVNLTDFNILAGNFGLPNRNFAQGDFNYDTLVNLTDFNILAGRFGGMLSGPTAFGRIPIRGSGDKNAEDLETLVNPA